MADTRQDNVIDGLKKVFTTIAQLQLSPDAQQHQQVITGLMTAIQKYIVMDAQKAAAGQAGMAGGSPGGPPGMGGPGGPSPMGGAPGGAPGGMPGAPGGGPMTPTAAGSPLQVAPGGAPGLSGFGQDLTNSDELRRMMNQNVNVS